MQALVLLCLLFVIIDSIAGFNMLVLHPLYSGSHEIQLRELSKALVTRRHRITYMKFKNFVTLPPPEHPNITFITIAVNNKKAEIPFVTPEERGRFMMPLHLLWKNGLNPWGIPMDAFRTIPPQCDTLLGDLNLRNRLENERFDVAIIDLATNECGVALMHHLNIPSIGYWPIPLSGGESVFSVGLSMWPSFTPSVLAQLTDHMGFAQRVKNYYYCFLNYLVMNFHFLITDYMIQKHLPGAPSSSDLLANMSGILENSDIAIDYPRELPPNVINVGCMQCRSARRLPQELEEFIQGAGSSGVILFSMGSTFDASVAPPLLLRRLLVAFSRLPQRVLMKMSGLSLIATELVVPPNVRIEQWLPQQDILGHKQTKAFFTHCGLHGVLESIWHGVPAIALPVFADQGDVAEMLRFRGAAERVDKDASVEEIYTAMKTVLDNPSYQRNARRLQAILRDQPSHPMDRAVWFVEYVARHRGAQHMKLSSRHFNMLQKHGLDILAIFILFLFITFKTIQRWRRVVTEGLFHKLRGYINRTHAIVSSRTKSD